MKMKLLLIDDDKPLRTITATNLKKAGYEVEQAENGEEGLAKGRTFLPDLIVSDIMMPIMDGLEFVREARDDETLKDCHIILLTARDRAADVLEGFAAQADDYLTKPFKLDELVARVAAGARLRQARLDLEQANEKLSTAMRHNAQLLGVAAHDLRNPINIISTYISLLGKEVIPEEMIKEVCLRRAKALARLIDNLLDHTKIQYGFVTLQLSEVDLPQLIHDAELLFSPIAEEAKVNLEFLIGEGNHVFTDHHRMIDILDTLFHNVILLTEENCTLTISTMMDKHDLVFTLRTTGTGFGEHAPEELFDCLVDGNVSETYDLGNLLGFAIVKKLILRMGGSVFAKNNNGGNGAMIGFRLPCPKGDTLEAAAARFAAAEVTQNSNL